MENRECIGHGDIDDSELFTIEIYYNIPIYDNFFFRLNIIICHVKTFCDFCDNENFKNKIMSIFSHCHTIWVISEEEE